MRRKKKRCSRHLSPMERSDGSRRSSLAKRPGSSGCVVRVYSSRAVYTFSRRISTSCCDLRPRTSGLNRMMVRRQPSSDLSIRMSRILVTSSVSTRSKMLPTPAWCAELRWTVRPVASTMPSRTSIERCENAAISSSFQPGGHPTTRLNTFSSLPSFRPSQSR